MSLLFVATNPPHLNKSPGYTVNASATPYPNTCAPNSAHALIYPQRSSVDGSIKPSTAPKRCLTTAPNTGVFMTSPDITRSFPKTSPTMSPAPRLMSANPAMANAWAAALKKPAGLAPPLRYAPTSPAKSNKPTASLPASPPPFPVARSPRPNCTPSSITCRTSASSGG